MDTDNPPSWEQDNENPPIYTPNAPISNNDNISNSNNHNPQDSTIAYDASGKAQFATIDVPNDEINDNINNNNNPNDPDNNELALSTGNDAAAAADAPAANNNGETYKNMNNSGQNGANSGKAVYNGNVNIGEGANVGNNNNINNYQRLPPWFESTGNASVDYKLARSRFCCCSLRAGIESLAIGVVLISIWDLLISAQFAEEQVLVSFYSLFRILGGICGFYGAWKYHKNASRLFYVFWMFDLLITVFLLIYSIYLISHCSNDYDDSSDDWGWWYRDCRYKYENLTGLYVIMCIAEVYCIIATKRFYKLMAEI